MKYVKTVQYPASPTTDVEVCLWCETPTDTDGECGSCLTAELVGLLDDAYPDDCPSHLARESGCSHCQWAETRASFVTVREPEPERVQSTGWLFPTSNARKAHWIGSEGRSLCGRYGSAGFPPEAFDTDTKPSTSDCKECRRRLDGKRIRT